MHAVDYMFDELQEEDPENYAVLQWVKFTQAAGEAKKKAHMTEKTDIGKKKKDLALA